MARTNEWTEETKVCSRCDKTKSLSEFHKRASSKDGRHPWCKQCKQEYAREYYEKCHENTPDNPSQTIEKTKVCTGCGEEKPLSAFHKRTVSKDGLSHHCRECHAQYYLDNLEEERAKRREYYQKNRERMAIKNREDRLRRLYDISLAEYDEMLEIQDGVCAICGMTPEKNGRRLSVDHNHETGEVRGLLCVTCNRAVGYLQDNSELCRQAMFYLRRWGC